MPYIDKKDRERLDAIPVARTPGELNYIFTKASRAYLELCGESYQHYNDIIGALECCKLELYRRRISGYEDKKRWKNGDVWAEEEHDPSVDTWGKVLVKE